MILCETDMKEQQVRGRGTEFKNLTEDLKGMVSTEMTWKTATK